jgi:hypothetical protein
MSKSVGEKELKSNFISLKNKVNQLFNRLAKLSETKNKSFSIFNYLAFNLEKGINYLTDSEVKTSKKRLFSKRLSTSKVLLHLIIPTYLLSLFLYLLNDEQETLAVGYFFKICNLNNLFEKEKDRVINQYRLEESFEDTEGNNLNVNPRLLRINKTDVHLDTIVEEESSLISVSQKDKDKSWWLRESISDQDNKELGITEIITTSGYNNDKDRGVDGESEIRNLFQEGLNILPKAFGRRVEESINDFIRDRTKQRTIQEKLLIEQELLEIKKQGTKHEWKISNISIENLSSNLFIYKALIYEKDFLDKILNLDKISKKLAEYILISKLPTEQKETIELLKGSVDTYHKVLVDLNLFLIIVRAYDHSLDTNFLALVYLQIKKYCSYYDFITFYYINSLMSKFEVIQLESEQGVTDNTYESILREIIKLLVIHEINKDQIEDEDCIEGNSNILNSYLRTTYPEYLHTDELSNESTIKLFRGIDAFFITNYFKGVSNYFRKLEYSSSFLNLTEWQKSNSLRSLLYDLITFNLLKNPEDLSKVKSKDPKIMEGRSVTNSADIVNIVLTEGYLRYLFKLEAAIEEEESVISLPKNSIPTIQIIKQLKDKYSDIYSLLNKHGAYVKYTSNFISKNLGSLNLFNSRRSDYFGRSDYLSIYVKLPELPSHLLEYKSLFSLKDFFASRLKKIISINHSSLNSFNNSYVGHYYFTALLVGKRWEKLEKSLVKISYIPISEIKPVIKDEFSLLTFEDFKLITLEELRKKYLVFEKEASAIDSIYFNLGNIKEKDLVQYKLELESSLRVKTTYNAEFNEYTKKGKYTKKEISKESSYIPIFELLKSWKYFYYNSIDPKEEDDMYSEIITKSLLVLSYLEKSENYGLELRKDFLFNENRDFYFRKDNEKGYVEFNENNLKLVDPLTSQSAIANLRKLTSFFRELKLLFLKVMFNSEKDEKESDIDLNTIEKEISKVVRVLSIGVMESTLNKYRENNDTRDNGIIYEEEVTIFIQYIVSLILLRQKRDVANITKLYDIMGLVEKDGSFYPYDSSKICNTIESFSTSFRSFRDHFKLRNIHGIKPVVKQHQLSYKEIKDKLNEKYSNDANVFFNKIKEEEEFKKYSIPQSSNLDFEKIKKEDLIKYLENCRVYDRLEIEGTNVKRGSISNLFLKLASSKATEYTELLFNYKVPDENFLILFQNDGYPTTFTTFKDLVKKASLRIKLDSEGPYTPIPFIVPSNNRCNFRLFEESITDEDIELLSSPPYKIISISRENIDDYYSIKKEQKKYINVLRKDPNQSFLNAVGYDLIKSWFLRLNPKVSSLSIPFYINGSSLTQIFNLEKRYMKINELSFSSLYNSIFQDRNSGDDFRDLIKSFIENNDSSLIDDLLSKGKLVKYKEVAKVVLKMDLSFKEGLRIPEQKTDEQINELFILATHLLDYHCSSQYNKDEKISFLSSDGVKALFKNSPQLRVLKYLKYENLIIESDKKEVLKELDQITKDSTKKQLFSDFLSKLLNYKQRLNKEYEEDNYLLLLIILFVAYFVRSSWTNHDRKEVDDTKVNNAVSIVVAVYLIYQIYSLAASKSKMKSFEEILNENPFITTTRIGPSIYDIFREYPTLRDKSWDTPSLKRTRTSIKAIKDNLIKNHLDLVYDRVISLIKYPLIGVSLVASSPIPNSTSLALNEYHDQGLERDSLLVVFYAIILIRTMDHLARMKKLDEQVENLKGSSTIRGISSLLSHVKIKDIQSVIAPLLLFVEYFFELFIIINIYPLLYSYEVQKIIALIL